MSILLNNVTNSIWHAFNALSSDNNGIVMKSKLKVLTANIGTLLDLYGVEKGLEHFRSTPSLNFQHFKYYLLKEVFSSLPDSLTLQDLREYESKIDEVCWLICKKNYLQRDLESRDTILSDTCVYQLFRVFCLLGDLTSDPKNQDSYQVVMHTWEVGLITSQLVTSLGSEWDREDYEALVYNMSGLRLSMLITLLETKYLTNIDPAVVEEAVTALSHTFVDDIIKKGCLQKKGYLLGTMREYWFVLQPTQLTYYKNQEEREQCGIICLDPQCWVDSTQQRILLHTRERCFELGAYDHRTRLQWLSALQLAISQSGGSQGYQRQLAARRRRQREAEVEEKRRRSSLIQDMGRELQAEKMARVAAELQFQEVKIEKEKQLEQLEALLEEETQAKRDEEIVRNLQARVLREEWEKREELERLQEEQRIMLEQEREKRIEFERKQKEKEAQLQEAERRLRELEEERQKLDMELHRTQDKMTITEKCMTELQTSLIKTPNPQVKVRRTMSFMPSTRDKPPRS
ncbi:differentially expressed in FDCP 6 homolog [Macrosteles quadrilineatus]|uniref:differentially expressed in FDCP 6 homolog n=1 Tax=Macrosteles quadrilineatus TaxID=74068 RepID=UPI0023E16B49|nr:differentially expressed in FDCP 6 homolog [Macrosteles quadrilineatus]